MVWVAVIIGVVLLIMFPKQVLAIIGLLVLALIARGCSYLEQEGHKQREKERVQVSITYDTEKCSADFPLLVVIQNAGYKTVNEVSWKVAAYRPGYSSNLVSYGGYSSSWDDRYTTDKILKEGEVNGLCYKVPHLEAGHDPATLTYDIIEKRIVFDE